MKRTNHIEVEAIRKRYGASTALDGISFDAKQGEFLSILGPSGCGKTTMLRLIAGLEKPTSGTIRFHGKDVSKLSVGKRNVGIVFQSYALFPNLTAEENIAYGLSGSGTRRREIKRRVDELLDLVGLCGMGRKYPGQLSGGQQQRVALARAMALSPDILLLDEPLSALDAKVRIMLRAEIRKLQKRLGVTTIMVTHDQEEALTMADRVLVMNEGRLMQHGTPTEVYDHPSNPFVASFIGSMNFIEGATKTGAGHYRAASQQLKVSPENGSAKLKKGETVTVAIRPEDIFIFPENPAQENVLLTRIHTMEYRGPLFRLGLAVNGTSVEADVPAEKVRRFGLVPSMEVPVVFPEDRLHVYGKGAH